MKLLAPGGHLVTCSCSYNVNESTFIEVLEHAAKGVGGKLEDKVALNKALHEAKVPDTLRGPVSFDQYGNVVGNIYIRKV